jgi:hypothetical protein
MTNNLTAMSVFNGSWNNLSTDKSSQQILKAVGDLRQDSKKATETVKASSEKIVDAISKKVANKSVVGTHIPFDYRQKLAEQARLAFESLPSDFVSSATSLSDAMSREFFRDQLLRTIRSAESEGTVMNSTPELAESAKAFLESLPNDFVESGTVGTPQGRQCLKTLCEHLASSTEEVKPELAEVSHLQRAGRPVSYIDVSDGEDEMPSGGDPVNDITLFDPDDEEHPYNPLFDGGMTVPGTLPINNVAMTAPPIVGSFNELHGR